MTNKLFYGDNLGVMRNHIADESIDLVYLDPPFNSNASYNVLFKAPDGVNSPAQIEAFDDTWHWTEVAEDAYWQVLRGPNTQAARMLEAMRGFLGQNDMMAYIAMMCIRLLELHRVLKPTGSLYLHCDPTASHYLKLILDAIFHPKNYRNEIIWKRSNPKSHGSVNFSTATDTILRYSKSNTVTFFQPYSEHDESYIKAAYKYVDDGGRYRLLPLLNPSDNRPNLTYEFLGVTRVWRWTKARMEEAYNNGLVVQLKDGSVPQYKKYLEDSKGKTLTNCWTDIPQASGNESLGYPTQKPVALLERIINASSNPGDTVLDPFCGCGTTVHAAQKLDRNWIGIDVTHLAVSLIERRLRDAFGRAANFETVGVPKDIGAARDLATRDKYEFQKWAITLIPDAQPFRGGKKGADTGIDGVVYLRIEKNKTDKAIVEVKGGNVSVDQIHKLKSVVEREKALTGLFVTLLPPTKPMIAEAAAAGFSDTVFGKIPRIQILTIEGLLNHKDYARLPAIDSSSFRKAKSEPTEKQDSMDL